MRNIGSIYKYTVMGLILTVTLVGVTGCSGSSSTNAEGAKSSATTAATSSLSNIDPEQPERVAEIYGKVKSIQGNVVIIAEMQRQQSGATLTDEEKAKKREQMQALSEEERKKFQASQEVMTGKNITLTIPVGIPVKIKNTGSANGPTVSDGTIASIKPGQVINIWTDPADPKSAEYVSLSNR